MGVVEWQLERDVDTFERYILNGMTCLGVSILHELQEAKSCCDDSPITSRLIAIRMHRSVSTHNHRFTTHFILHFPILQHVSTIAASEPPQPLPHTPTTCQNMAASVFPQHNKTSLVTLSIVSATRIYAFVCYHITLLYYHVRSRF
jgi:hypothetical protein